MSGISTSNEAPVSDGNAASSVWLIVLFPVITAATIWIYAFILVFSALWFGYYCLRALQRMRAEESGARHVAPVVPY